MAKENFKEILNSLVGSINDENIELFKKLYEDKEFEIGTPEKFFYKYTYPYEKLSDGMLRYEFGNNSDIIFLYNNYKFIERHFKKLIQEKDGMVCCADKSRYIVNSLVEYFKDGKDIVFDYDQEYIFHLPKEIFNTQDDIIEFYGSLKRLYMGDSKSYIIFLKKIYKKDNEK